MGCPAPTLLLVAPVAALLAAALVACGRPASEADCELILDRYVEAQMREMKILDAGAVEKTKESIRAQLTSELKGCVGRRITDGLLACVRQAQTPRELDACIR
jgi:hypothetical protein